MKRARVAMLTMTASLAFAASAGAASFGPGAQLASVHWDRLEQGDDASTASAISGDGRFVVFDTRAGNFYPDDDFDPPGLTRRGGVFRYEIATREILPVADGDFVDPDNITTIVERGAHNPSVSESGRYVVFTSAHQLVAADTNDHIDVYVRDMEAPKSSPSAFELVSARDGSATPATYATPGSPTPDGNPGADVFAGHAISDDGRTVAFRTVAPSDLPAAGGPTVPAGQIFLRDLNGQETTLVTRDKTTAGPVGGALPAIVVSGDGSTVAWVGTQAPAQTRFLNGELDDPGDQYYLWRRVADGPAAPTRRVTGPADPDDPACNDAVTPVNSNPTATGPCFGPLTGRESELTDLSGRAPAISADGFTVAFVASAAQRPLAGPNPLLDLFVTSMAPGVSRKAGTTELTRDTADPTPATSNPIESVSMSGNGRYLAVSTARIRFVLPALSAIGPAFRPVAGNRELYVVDLNQRTIERAVRNSFGGDSAADVANNPSISVDGQVLSFSSPAGDLFFGDANSKADAFYLTRGDESGGDAPPPPPPPPLTFTVSDGGDDEDSLIGTIKRLKGGRLQVSVSAPGSGKLTLFARTRGSNAKTVARTSKTAGGAETVRMTLSLKGSYKKRVAKGRALAVTLRARFVPDPSGTALSDTADSRFARISGSAKKSSKGGK